MTGSRTRTYVCYKCKRKIHDEESHSQTIYFVSSEEMEFIKIGITKDLKDRMKKLQNASPFNLKVLRTVKGEMAHEVALHRRFARLQHNREWFRVDLELLQFIESLEEGEPIKLSFIEA